MGLENSGGRGVRVSYGQQIKKPIEIDTSLTVPTQYKYFVGPIKIHKVKIEAVSNINPIPIDIVNGILYGYFNNILYKSTDEGDTWEYVYTFDGSAGDIRRIFLCSDGQLLVLFNTKLFKSISYTNPIVWKEIISLDEGVFVEWSLDGDGTKFILADYGVPHTVSNYLWISLDSGNSWTRYEKNTIHPGNDEGTHFHGVSYDYVEDRFWHCMGDNTYRGHYYSDDQGLTWIEVPLGAGMIGTAAQATTISPTAFGMVLGSDSGANGGMYRILRKDDPSDLVVEMMWRWPNELTSVRGFPFKNVYHKESGLTFICWRSDVSNNPPFITWTNGLTGGILYEWENSWTATDGIRNIVVFPNGKIKAWVYLSGIDDNIITIDKFIQSEINLSDEDTGLLRGGSISATDNNCMAVGQGATAVGSTIAVGPGCISSSFGAVSMGVKAVAGANDVAIGYDSVVGGTNAIAIGRGTICDGNEAVVLGANSTSTFDRSVLVGEQIIDSGIQNVLIGYDVDVTNNGIWNVVIGAFADADGSSNVVVGRIAKTTGTQGVALGTLCSTVTQGVALGYSAVCDTVNSVAIGNSTNTELDNSVAVGTRDLHIQGSTKGVVLTSPDGTKYRITVDNAGVLSTTVVP